MFGSLLKIKKVISVTLAVVSLATVLSGCNFSVGDSNNGKKHDDIFIDADKSNYSSFIKYRFKLDGDYGQMEVAVDTSNGHSFELSQQNTGFNILDKDGNVVIYAACVGRDVYGDMVSEIDSTRNFNGRDFFYEVRGDDRDIYTLYSYMADCGLDCGLVLETHTEDIDVFKLIAFDGKALENASSDLNAYKSETKPVETEPVKTEPIETDHVPTKPATYDNSELLASLPSDYNKVNWGVVYNISEDYPGLYISLTPYTSFGSYYLIVGVTSLYEENISFSADATALTGSGEKAGNMFIYFDSISRGMTAIETIYCGENEPDGRITWENIKIDLNKYKKVVDWEADTKVSGNSSEGEVSLDYSIYSVTGEEINVGNIAFLLVDDNGFVTAMCEDYVYDEKGPHSSYIGSCNLYGTPEAFTAAKQILVFAVPTATE